MKWTEIRTEWKRKGHTGLPVTSGEHLPVLRFPALDETGMVSHCFTTRFGGVSGRKEGTEHLSSLNLGLTRGDDEANVRENFRRVAEELGAKAENFVLTDQTHTTNVRLVTEADAGKGLFRERDYHDVDGLVTNVPGLVLSVFVADCVPVLFVDPVKRAIGAAHSGWRGTVGRIGAEVVRMMQENYGTDPKDLITAVGPSICRDCYEVSREVADAFAEEFAGHETEILMQGREGHAQLDLWQTNRIVLLDAGVLPQNISVTELCTCCNPKSLYSHRASGGMRGNLAACLMIR
jgi:YfiH family protein